ncbi:MAG TPA: class I adenylate-forming enzyme family protein [Bacteriovoracaceae bacterium]|nr:class I adenylate-forming enzyme family protein [Bacteriovoracaceae bacterium]
MFTALSLSERIADTLERYGKNILLRDTNVTWTGSEVACKISQIQKYIEVSTLPGSLVGVCFPNWAVQGLTILAVIHSKRIPVILSYSDLSEQTEYWIEKTRVSLLLSLDELTPRTGPLVQSIGIDVEGNIIDDESLRNFPLSPQTQTSRAPKGTALVLYTSGSTGEPKGICVPERGIIVTSDYLIDYFKLDERTVTPIVLPVCHSMALNTQFIPTFLAGGCSTFINARLGMNKLFRHIEKEEGTFISLIGEVLRVCWEEKKRKKLNPNLRVQHVQLAGGMILEQHVRMAREIFPNALIHKGYGLTEAIRVTMIDHRDPAFVQSIVGTTLPFQEIEIRTTDGFSADLDDMGEVFVKGPNVMLGILGRPITHLDSRGFMATGDLGSLNVQGQLAIFGRKDSIFKVNGLKVSGLAIEKVAYKVGPYVREAKCLAVTDQRRAGNKVVLFLEILFDSQPDFFKNYFETFNRSLWNELKTLNHFPRDIILMAKFPRTSNGKLSIKGLQKIWEEDNKQMINLSDEANILYYKVEESASDFSQKLIGDVL